MDMRTVLLGLFFLGLFLTLGSYAQTSSTSRVDGDCMFRTALNKSSDANAYTLICLNKHPSSVKMAIYPKGTKKPVFSQTIPKEKSKAFHKKFEMDKLDKGKYLLRVGNGCKIEEHLMISQ